MYGHAYVIPLVEVSVEERNSRRREVAEGGRKGREEGRHTRASD
jgi:hypothetical protein